MRRHAALWFALGVGPLGWMLQQQLLSNLEHFDCRYGGGSFGVLIAVLVAIGVVTGGVLAWRLRAVNIGVLHFLGTLGVMSTAMFALAIALQTLAGVIVPVCVP